MSPWFCTLFRQHSNTTSLSQYICLKASISPTGQIAQGHQQMDIVQPVYMNHLNAKVQVLGDGGCRMLMLHYAVVLSFLMPVALFRAKKYTLQNEKNLHLCSFHQTLRPTTLRVLFAFFSFHSEKQGTIQRDTCRLTKITNSLAGVQVVKHG